MIRVDAEKSDQFCEGMTRRGFLHAGSLGLAGLTLPQFQALEAGGAITKDQDRNAVFLFLVGGPSQLDTFDPKPDAPAEIRGPYKAIRTNVPGIRISEIFPRTAKIMDKVAILRSLHHTAAGVHDTGHQLMQTGRLFRDGIEQPHAGCVVEYLRGAKGDLPGHVLLPGPIGPTGGNMPHGQNAGFLRRQHDPFVLNANPDAKPADANFHRTHQRLSSPRAREAFDLSREPQRVRDAYGRNKFGQGCLLARRLIERGVRFVTVNMFETVFNEITWDIHGSAPFSPIECYGKLVGPMFDHAYSTLITDLSERGLLEDTMVVAMGEFGRTPKINPAGGRDHWPQCWSILFSGGGVKGGNVVGASDAIAAYPKDRPTQPAEVVATVYHSLGIDPKTTLPGPDSRPIPVIDPGVDYIRELF